MMPLFLLVMMISVVTNVWSDLEQVSNNVRTGKLLAHQAHTDRQMTWLWLQFGISLVLSQHFTFCLDNGLARPPPMGWLAWER